MVRAGPAKRVQFQIDRKDGREFAAFCDYKANREETMTEEQGD